MPTPPAGTSERWEFIFKVLAAALALAPACWSLVTAHSIPGDLHVPGLALAAAGILVLDALPLLLACSLIMGISNGRREHSAP